MLKKFTLLNGVSGYEEPVRKEILNEIKGFYTTAQTDAMGNLIVYKAAENEKNAKTLLLSAHMDEVGFIITGITSDGLLNFDTVGGIDTSVILSKKVRCGEVNGVIGMKAVHLSSKEERNRLPEIKDLFIDIGAKDKEEAMKYILPGDCFAFAGDYVEFGNSMVKAKALDDRAGCAVIINALKIKSLENVNLLCLFNTQEETGLRGAKAAVFGKKPDYAIVVECTTAGDISKTKDYMKVTEIGGGAAISVMDSASIADEELCLLLRKTAEQNKIKYQLKRAATGGNDAGAIHTANGGIKTCTVSVPSRYIHSPSSVISLKDFECVEKLIEAFILKLEKEENENV